VHSLIALEIFSIWRYSIWDSIFCGAQ